MGKRASRSLIRDEKARFAAARLRTPWPCLVLAR